VWRSGGTVSEDDRVRFGATDEHVAAILGEVDTGAGAQGLPGGVPGAMAASTIDEQVCLGVFCVVFFC
jgi:hypothetical protein